ncbi:TPA: hypothetical protein O4G77_004852 [Vibrio alginolyticus]|nr:hypothetical protein [Vibrio alginolyticus]
MSLNAAKAELRSADRSLSNMKAAPNFEIFEEEWRDFLNCIEKVWNKTERGCQSFRASSSRGKDSSRENVKKMLYSNM